MDKKRDIFQNVDLLQHYAKDSHRGLAQNEREQIMTKWYFF